jgi:hypothetical protein
MWATHPEMAKRWEEETPEGSKLPEKASSKKKPVREQIKLAIGSLVGSHSLIDDVILELLNEDENEAQTDL